jgi:NADPH:quinone reductase-like Zn-dependent oxidoreductase
MKAIVYTRYGPPDVLELVEVERPRPKANEVLIKVHAASVNSSDWELLTAKPAYARIWGPLKPRYKILGSDIAGRVEAVGSNAKRFKPGDAVFGDIFERWGGFAEYVCAPEDVLMLKPAGMTFDEAAAIPQAAVVALQGLRDKGQLQSGQKVLINGAGGGGGTFAVQIARSFGADVTGVDSAIKLDLMRSLGADQVIDYAHEDFTRTGQRYDLILDFVASRSVFDCRRALRPKGRYVVVGGSIPRLLQVLILGPWISMTAGKKMGILGWRPNTRDLGCIKELFEAGKVTPVIDRRYPLSEVAEAMRHLGAGLAKGKVVITVADE